MSDFPWLRRLVDALSLPDLRKIFSINLTYKQKLSITYTSTWSRKKNLNGNIQHLRSNSVCEGTKVFESIVVHSHSLIQHIFSIRYVYTRYHKGELRSQRPFGPLQRAPLAINLLFFQNVFWCTCMNKCQWLKCRYFSASHIIFL